MEIYFTLIISELRFGKVYSQLILLADFLLLQLKTKLAELWNRKIPPLYSRDLKSDHLKFGNVWNPDFLKVVFQMVPFSNGWALAMAAITILNYLKTGPFKIRTFLSRFQMFGLPNFKSHSKFGPFATQPLFDHLKSRLVRISDPHCSQICSGRTMTFLKGSIT